jgi:hypothetical protein
VVTVKTDTILTWHAPRETGGSPVTGYTLRVALDNTNAWTTAASLTLASCQQNPCLSADHADAAKLQVNLSTLEGRLALRTTAKALACCHPRSYLERLRLLLVSLRTYSRVHLSLRLVLLLRVFLLLRLSAASHIVLFLAVFPHVPLGLDDTACYLVRVSASNEFGLGRLSPQCRVVLGVLASSSSGEQDEEDLLSQVKGSWVLSSREDLPTMATVSASASASSLSASASSVSGPKRASSPSPLRRKKKPSPAVQIRHLRQQLSDRDTQVASLTQRCAALQAELNRLHQL